jgi:competence/damage-inducible protein CinA-like protein
MKVEVLAVGTELLTPHFQDTNSLYLARRLEEVGLRLSFKTVVGDDARDLARAAGTALGRSGLVIAMGGLGPTEDDRTAEVFARVLGRRRVFKPEVLKAIRARFSRRGLKMPSTNRKQAYIIQGAEVLENPNGTAPGQWLTDGRRSVALLPGPPRELEPMFEASVLPRLRSGATGVLVRRVLRLAGLGESLMESKIRTIYGRLPGGVALTTLASPGDLAIHITCVSRTGRDAAEKIAAVEKALRGKVGPFIYSNRGETLEEVVAGLLTAKRRTLACAESCSGGLLAHRLTNVPGSSAYFLAGIVAYGNAAKTDLLGVPRSLLLRHGAVSAPVARAMAAGVRRRAKATYGIGITGIAGPTGGTVKKPVGLVYISLAEPDRVEVRKHLFFGGRKEVKFQSSQRALELLRRRLIR